MSKLTAKLSDGTEWEVVGDEVYQSKAAKGESVIWLKPLKPSPPKEVWANVYPDLGYGYHYKTLKEAEKNLEPSGKTHRYVLAEEPEAKKARYYPNHFNAPEPERQPREWWCVYDHNLTMNAMFASKEAAFRHYNIAKIDRDFPFLVREVLPHGQDKADS